MPQHTEKMPLREMDREAVKKLSPKEFLLKIEGEELEFCQFFSEYMDWLMVKSCPLCGAVARRPWRITRRIVDSHLV